MVTVVRQERSGWRDLELSKRHRLWGTGVPCCDLDFIEYDGNQPVAIIEYKNAFAAPVLDDNTNVRALKTLASRAKIPFFGVRYTEDFSKWKVCPLNMFARWFVSEDTVMTEYGYVSLLYRLRKKKMPADIFPITSVHSYKIQESII